MPRTWIYARYPIVNHISTSDSLSISTTSNYSPVSGHGYFIQNHVNTLDLEGEWAYDAHNLYLYSEQDPNQSQIIFSNSMLGFDFNGANQATTCVGVTFVNLAFMGFNLTPIRIREGYGISHFVSILDCDFSYCHNGIELSVYSDGVIARNTFRHMTNNGIVASGIRLVIEDNEVSDVSTEPGRCETNNNNSVGINFTGVDGICRYNRVDSTGYNGIRFEGQRLNVEKNVISNFTINKNDGGGIYSFNGFYLGPTLPYTGYKYGQNTIRQNIIRDGQANFTLFSTNGNSTVGGNRSVGIYSDNLTKNNSFIDNVISNVKGLGFLFNETTLVDSLEADGNLLFNIPFDRAFHPYLFENRYFTYKKNIIIESTHVRQSSKDNVFDLMSLNSKSKSNFNSFLRFDYNNDSTIFINNGDRISFDQRREYLMDSLSYWVSVNPEIINPEFSQELIQNGHFQDSLQHWNFTAFNLNTSPVTQSSILNFPFEGDYLLVNTIGGSFSAINKFFELSQNVLLEANSLYELNFSASIDFGLCHLNYPSFKDFPIEVEIGNKLGETKSRVFLIYPNKNKFKLYIIPNYSGNLPLSFSFTSPCRSKYYIDNISFRKVLNYSSDINDYLIFKVNETRNSIFYQLPRLPIGWYYINPRKKTVVHGEIEVSAFSGVVLIKSNRKLPERNFFHPILK